MIVSSAAMTVRLHPLRAVAGMFGDDMADPFRWLTKQVLAGRVRARKVGRCWYMTDDDINHMLEVLANVSPTPAPAGDTPAAIAVQAVSAASQRRRVRGASILRPTAVSE